LQIPGSSLVRRKLRRLQRLAEQLASRAAVGVGPADVTAASAELRAPAAAAWLIQRQAAAQVTSQRLAEQLMVQRQGREEQEGSEFSAVLMAVLESSAEAEV
jgi:hypothetical protein